MIVLDHMQKCKTSNTHACVRTHMPVNRHTPELHTIVRMQYRSAVHWSSLGAMVPST